MYKLLKFFGIASIFISPPVLCGISLSVHSVSNVTHYPNSPFISYDVMFTANDISSTDTSPSITCIDSGCKMNIGILGLDVIDSFEPDWGRESTYGVTFPSGITSKKELLEYYLSKTGALPRQGKIHVDSVQIDPDAITKEQCLTFIFNDGSINGYKPFPGAPCFNIPKPDVSCSLNTNIVLEHGTVSKKDLNGHEASADVMLSCTSATDVYILLSGATDGKIALNPAGTVSSTLEINDILLGNKDEKFSVPASGLNLNLKSTLLASGDIDTGSFSGSAVIIITPI